MTNLPDEMYSVATVREIDRAAIEDAGIPGYTLMTRAGSAAVSEARGRYPEAKRWQVLCGAGNNAGDGYVVARLLASEGIVVSVITLVDPESLEGDAATAHRDFAAEGGVANPWSGELDASADLIVDAILGSGLTRDVAGKFAAAVAAINGHPGVILSLDIPTGLHGDAGAVLGCAVRADMTVTFVACKTGLFLDQGPDRCGEIVLADLGIARECSANAVAEFRRMNSQRTRTLLPKRRRAAHKGDFGHVLVIGGGAGMPGAVRLCAEAALRSGAGRVSVATDPGHASIIVATCPELMAHAIRNAGDLEPLLEKASVIALGPGLGRSEWAATLVAALTDDERPSVWDADALNWLAESPTKAANRVITPHPGEAGTLLDSTSADVQGDRRAALAKLHERYGGVVVLKGAGSLVTSAAGVPWLCTSGNPGMAAAGMGDVLTGIVAALIAQGLSVEEAAVAGVEIHARAGDRAARSGERGLLASDLLAEIRGVIN
ncbi:MAG: NAD(P)H-hydrate dehydratase [Proteobacteria bacterium]|nr:NAD(P)H-hydrate dehydratase [Pseudomonadota bacterium]